MSTPSRILCVDDEKKVLSALRRFFYEDDYEIFTAESGREGLDILAKNASIQLVISDYRMPGMDGVDFLRQVWARWPDTVRIVISGHSDAAAAVEAIKEGQIYKFVPKPWKDDEFRETVASALKVHSLRKKNEQFVNELIESNVEFKHLREDPEKMPGKNGSELLQQNKNMRFAQQILYEMPIAVIGLDRDNTIIQSSELADNIFTDSKRSLFSLSAYDVLPAEINSFLQELRETPADMKLEYNGQQLTIKAKKLSKTDGREGTVLVLLVE